MLVDYQNAEYAEKYQSFVEQVQSVEQAISPTLPLTRVVAVNLFKLMAYKDEYEVARLYSAENFRKKLNETFTGDYKLSFHLAPPFLNGKLDELGRPRKIRLGAWMLSLFGLLARGKRLRGTVLDPFALNGERREERALINDYRDLVENLLRSVELCKSRVNEPRGVIESSVFR